MTTGLPPDHPATPVSSAQPVAESRPDVTQPAFVKAGAMPGALQRWWQMALVLVLVGAVMGLAQLWTRLGVIQEQLARQSADAGALSVEARTVAREALALAKDVVANARPKAQPIVAVI